MTHTQIVSSTPGIEPGLLICKMITVTNQLAFASKSQVTGLACHHNTSSRITGVPDRT